MFIIIGYSLDISLGYFSCSLPPYIYIYYIHRHLSAAALNCTLANIACIILVLICDLCGIF